jgi:hypothetical protein
MRMHGYAIGLSAALAALGAGCDRTLDPDAPTDGEAPLVRVDSPTRGAILGDVDAVTVTGTVTDAEGDVDELTINGVRADVGSTGAFTISVPVTPGTNLVQVIATDAGRNKTTETRSVLAGVMSASNITVPDALAVGISDEAFVAIGDAAAGFITGSDLGAVLAPSNPVVDVGWSGPGDCLYVRGNITGVTVGGADIALSARPGGLSLDTALTTVEIRMHLDYAAACLDGSRDVTIRASLVGVAGDLDVGLAAGAFDIELVSPDVTLEGLDVDLGGIPGAIVDLLQVDALLEWVLPWAVEKFVAPMIGNALGGLGAAHTVSVLGKPIEFQMTPAQLDFDASGARVRLDSRVEVGGDAGPGFVYVRNTVPDLATSDGFRIALADDVANQLFAGFWGAGGMKYRLPLSSGDYGEVGVLFDAVTIEALLPPSVRADGDGALSIVIGDLIASFERGGDVVTRIAINGTVALSVVPSGDLGLSLRVGDPAIDIDFLAEGVDGANSLDQESFEALVSFAATRATNAVAGLVGVIPLPAIGGVMLSDVEVDATAGYLRVDGRLTQ